MEERAMMNTKLQSISEAQDPMVHPPSNTGRAELEARVVKNVNETSNDSFRRSQLPQRVTARQSSTGVRPTKTARPSENALCSSIKQNLHEARFVSDVGKVSVSSTEQDRKQTPSQAKAEVTLPNNVRRSLSMRKERSENSPGPSRFPRVSHSNPVSHLAGPRSLATPSNSSMKPVTQSEPLPTPNIMHSKTKRPLSGVSCISIVASKNEDDCGEETSGQATCISESLPIQRGKGRSDNGLSINHPVAKNALSNARVKSAGISTGQIPIKNQRPPFTATQQHFSPRKSFKTPIASVSTQSKVDVRTTSSEIFQSQIELMQLYLLHRSAAKVQVQWQESADQSMKTHFAIVCKRRCNLQRYIQNYETSINQSALLAWHEDTSSVELAQNVQLLSRNILELYKMFDSGGKYTGALSRFESWLTNVCHIWNSRKKSHPLDFIEGIGDDWRADIATLERKLATCSRELSSMRMPQENSALGHTLCSFQDMVTNSMDELHIIRKIEDDVLAQEMFWIERQVNDLVGTAKPEIGPFPPTSYLGVWNGPSEL